MYVSLKTGTNSLHFLCRPLLQLFWNKTFNALFINSSSPEKVLFDSQIPQKPIYSVHHLNHHHLLLFSSNNCSAKISQTPTMRLSPTLTPHPLIKTHQILSTNYKIKVKYTYYKKVPATTQCSMIIC